MRAIAIVSAIAGATALAAHSGSAPRATCGKLLPPTSGAYFSAFPDFISADYTYLEDYVKASKVDEFERLVGRKIVWAYFVHHWYRGLAFPRANVLEVWRNGQIPYIAIHPHTADFYGPGPRQQNPEQVFTIQRILDGDFDWELRAWADAARATNIPILAEFGTEINDDWGPWNGKWNGAGETTGYGDPAYPDGAERFRDAFRRLVTIFREEGATNVTWFFHADSHRQDDSWNKLHWYYPGDEYVDWIGISNYGTLFPEQPIADFVEKLDHSRVYPDLTAMSRRPMAVVEMGVVDDAAHGKPGWIRRAFAAMRSGRYPRIRGALWWHMNVPPSDTRVDSSPDALRAFREAVAHPFWGAKPRFTGNCRPASPKSVRASRGLFADRVRLTWAPVPNAARYEVWRSAARGGERALVGTTTSPRFDDRGVRAGRTYSYAVRAVNVLGRSGVSAAAAGFRRR